MNWRKAFSFLGLLVLVASAAPLSAFAFPQQQEDALAKIDPLVLQGLEIEGQADYFVWLVEQADLSYAAQLQTKLEKGAYVYETLRATAERTQNGLRTYLDGQGVSYRAFYIANAILVEGGSYDLLLALAGRPEVARIVPPPDPRLEPTIAASPEDKGTAAIEWNITRVGAPDVWNQGFRGEGSVVGDNDTGIQYQHPALVNQYRGNLGGGNFDHNYNWWDDWGGTPSPTPLDYDSHGTHTAGTMVGDDGGSNQIGVAPGAKIIACAGLSLTCLEFFLAPWDLNHANPRPDLAPDSVNNSWYDPSGFDYRPIIQNMNAAGIAVIKSAGNNGPSCGTISNPGYVPEIIATAAFAQGDTIASFSSRGPMSNYGPTILKPEVAAPGSNVRSSVPTNNYGLKSGTSMAAPHTTALVALMWQAAPCIRGDVPLTKQIMMETAEAKIDAQCPPFVDHPNDVWGWGILDMPAAVQAAIAQCGASGYLAGYVTDATLLAPIAGATVTADGYGGGSWQRTTDASGYYTFTLSAGDYDVTAEHPHYTTQTAVGVEVVTGTLTTQSFVLQPKGRLWGYVTDYDNGFGLDATVTASDGSFTYTHPVDGYYELYLDAGSYLITATAQDYAPGIASVTIVAGADTRQDLALLAAVSFDPTPVHVTLAWNTTDSLAAVLTNRLPTPYVFEFMELPGGYMPTLLGQPDNGTCATWPGPDGFGYTGEVIDYDWVEISGSGTPVALGDDAVGGPFPVGFTFNLYGTDYTSFYVSSNGHIDFGAGATALTNQCPLPNATTPNNLIGLLWDDLDPGDTGDLVYYQSFPSCPVGAGACLVVQYENYHHYPGGGAIAGTFEAVLFDNGSVLIQFEDAGAEEGSGSTTGMEGNNAAANYGLTYACNAAASLSDGLAACFVYPGSTGCAGGDVLWLGEVPIAGTVPASTTLPGTLNVNLLFTATLAAGVDQPGDYYADLRVKGDPDLTVRVTMTVLPPSNLGKLAGVVTGNRPGGPLEAEILIEDGGGMTWTLTTDPDTGAYAYWLEQGSYDVTASAAGYISQTAGVAIQAGLTTTQDFELLLDAPWIDVVPTSMEETLTFGQSASQTLTISNWGAQDLLWELMEVDNGYDPLAMCQEYYGGDLGSAWGPGGTRDRGNLFEINEDTVISEIYAYLNFASATDVYYIVYQADSLLGTYTQLFSLQVMNVGPGQQWYSSGPIAVPVEAGKFYYVGASWNGSANYYRASANTTPYATQCFGTLHTGYPATAAGYPPGPSFNNTYGSGYIADYGFGIATGGGDVPWLSESVVSGTVPAGSFVDVDVTFDAGAVAEPGHYMADLRIQHNDPLADNVVVPVTMTVLPSGDVGKLEGIIESLGYCDAGSDPLEAAVLIESSSGMTWTATSDPATGYYYRWLAADTYTVTASAPEHLDAWAVVQVTAQQTTTQDFDLRYIESCMDITPLAGFSLSLPVDSQFTDTLTLWNDGAGDLAWELRETTATMGLASPVSLPAAAPVESLAGEVTSIGRAPHAAAPAHAAPGLFEHILAVPAFGVNLFDDSLYAIPDLDFPGTWSAVGATGIGSAYCGDFAGGDFTTLYIINNDNQSLYAVDTATGVSTLIGPSPAAGLTWTGMAWDPTTFTMYGSATDGSNANLYTINLDTGATTVVGPITSYALTIDIAIDGSGQMYGVDIGSDVLITIDKSTGAASLVGSLGFAANYAQGLDFDLDNNILYWAAYGASGELRVIDTSTGASAFVGAFPGGAEVDAFSTQTGGAALWVDVPWVSEVPTSGVTLADSWFDVDVIFDTTGLTLGECYTASLAVLHDDPGWDSPVMLPLELCVVGAVTPTASFDASSPVCLGETTYFTDTSAGYPTSWLWAFGDGMTSTLQYPTHVYAAVDSYTVTLTACNDMGCDTAMGTVEVLALPEADFTYTVDGLTATFTDASLNATAWLWAFGDGVTSTLQNPVHTYDAAGTYPVTLTVYGLCGEDTVEMPVTVSLLPVAGFESNAPVCLGEPMVFTNTSINADEYLWDLGDGATSTETHPVHLYAAAGLYDVSLEACKDPDCDVYTATVEVLAPPEADFTYVMNLLTFTFTNASVNADTYLWDLGDGETSTETDPVHTYAAAGAYTVTLEATGACGTDVHTVVVEASWCVNVTIVAITPTINGCVVDFAAALTGDPPFAYLWDMGSFGTSTAPTPTVDFQATGTYTVTLDVTNCAMGHDTATLAVEVTCARQYTIYLPLIFKAGSR